MNKAMNFQDWWMEFFTEHKGDVCNFDPKEFAKIAWDASRESEMLANHPNVEKYRRENKTDRRK